MDRVLQMRKQDALLDHHFANAICPYRKPILESKFSQVVGAFQIQLAAGAFFCAERNHVIVTEAEKFRNMAPHHYASEGRGQRRDEQTMITPCHRAGNSSGCITPKAVGNEPLTIE